MDAGRSQRLKSGMSASSRGGTLGLVLFVFLLAMLLLYTSSTRLSLLLLLLLSQHSEGRIIHSSHHSGSF